MKLLFLSDSHLGFDLPFSPKDERIRRGTDFFRMYEMALKPAFDRQVDAVIHGGDILYRSKVPSHLVQMAFDPLRAIADDGIPVYIVPGNHERSKIPYPILAMHPNIHIFTKPKTFYLELSDGCLALAGFPFQKGPIRHEFHSILKETAWTKQDFDVGILCMHQSIDGASIKQGDLFFVFRNKVDVIRIQDLPRSFSAALSGHIHRYQVLETDLDGYPVAVPVFYPGSIERTSFQEKDEAKGFLILDLTQSKTTGRWQVSHQFHELPARPMIQISFDGTGKSAKQLHEQILSRTEGFPPDSVVGIRIHGKLSAECLSALTIGQIRSSLPKTMSLNLSLPDMRKGKRLKNPTK